ncbi:uncharacterized protein LOC131626961 [Vicia villosa]|uniref:uncharacterized protein LOC131626961 n=1 Tax=Vicia villosa TaxID=3911 RepID=UPI00273A7DF8|nr:uncharacterized protein LOC131626961 [Vicia villosa]
MVIGNFGKCGVGDPRESYCRFKIGNGFSTLFWKASWLETFCLKKDFSDLYENSSLFKVAVAGMGGWVNGVWTWGNFGINPLVLAEHNLESEMDSLCVLLEGRGPCNAVGDEAVWRAESDRVFYTVSCYKFYVGCRIPYGPFNKFDGALGLVWKAEVPFKIKAFDWSLLVNRLLTKDLLLHRGITFLVDNFKCVFDGVNPESRNHSFFTCSSVKAVWSVVVMWIGKPYGGVEVDCLRGFMDWLSFCKKKKVKEGKLGVVWLATLWTLWLNRNGVCFQNEVWNMDNTIWSIKFLVWKWAFIGDITHSICSCYDFNKDPLLFISQYQFVCNFSGFFGGDVSPFMM